MDLVRLEVETGNEESESLHNFFTASLFYWWVSFFGVAAQTFIDQSEAQKFSDVYDFKVIPLESSNDIITWSFFCKTMSNCYFLNNLFTQAIHQMRNCMWSSSRVWGMHMYTNVVN